MPWGQKKIMTSPLNHYDISQSTRPQYPGRAIAFKIIISQKLLGQTLSWFVTSSRSLRSRVSQNFGASYRLQNKGPLLDITSDWNSSIALNFVHLPQNGKLDHSSSNLAWSRNLNFYHDVFRSTTCVCFDESRCKTCNGELLRYICSK